MWFSGVMSERDHGSQEQQHGPCRLGHHGVISWLQSNKQGRLERWGGTLNADFVGLFQLVEERRLVSVHARLAVLELVEAHRAPLECADEVPDEVYHIRELRRREVCLQVADEALHPNEAPRPNRNSA